MMQKENKKIKKEELLGKELEKIKQELQEMKKKAEEYLGGWKRALADFANFKKEQERAKEEFVKFSQESLILEILPILDNFEVAWKNLPKNLGANPWVKGIHHIKSQLENLLQSKGVERIGKVGEDFDPQIHEAVEYIKEEKLESSSMGDKEKESQEKKRAWYLKVSEVVQSGYKLNGKVIRAAKVKVKQEDF